MNAFYTLSPYKDTLNILSNDIYRQIKYPEIRFPSQSFVDTVIKKYIDFCLSLNEKKDGVYFYNGVGSNVKDNIFITSVYSLMGGKLNPYDITLRDRIWVVISLVMQNAQKDYRFIPFWKPNVITQSDIDKTDSNESFFNSTIETETEQNKTSLLPWIIGASVLFIIIKRKKS